MGQTIVVDELILNSAVRYALGRRTYIVNTVCREVLANIKIITNSCIDSIISDIISAAELGSLGDDCDVKDWLNLKQMLENELERRDNGR